MCPPRADTRVGPYRDAAACDANPRSATVVVFAATETARYTDRESIPVDDDDRVHAIGLARAAEILERFAGAVRARR
jgi:hypothetical protein